MTVFKTYFKVLNKNKTFIIIYTAILLVFAISNMKTNDSNYGYVDEKSDIAIVNNDKAGFITKDFTKYIRKNANLVKFNNEEEISDALFYRSVDYVLYIPSDFSKDFMSGNDPKIDIKSTGSYDSTLANRLVSRYFKSLKIYRDSNYSGSELLSKTNDSLSESIETEIISKLDTDSINSMVFYFNFESYSIIACLIYIICLILLTFNSDKIRKRTIISSTDYKKNNRFLLLANCVYSLIVWLFYVIIAVVLFKEVLFSTQGLILVLNSLLFTMCITSLAFMIGILVNNKDAISGITNVLAIGSSFLCGAFVQTELLPDTVLKVAHILPTYYYINTNELLKTIEEFNYTNLLPIIKNSIIILIFIIVFVIMSNFISRKKEKFD